MWFKVSGKRQMFQKRVGGSLNTKQEVDKGYDLKESLELYF